MVKNKNLGFTLIELLVVISIIGLLSTFAIISLDNARKKARDGKRAADIKQLQTALDLYFNDNDQYPSSADVIFPGILTVALTPTYISKIPADPNTSGTPYHYYTASQNPAAFYAIRIGFETKTACYVCGGAICTAGTGWWGLNICQ